MALIDYAFDRDTRSDMRRIRFLLIIGVFVCIAFFKLCSELKLSIRGRDATATIVRAEPSLYNPSNQHVFYNYVDEDGQTQHVERTVSGLNRPLESGEKLPVVYRKGHERDAVFAKERSMQWPMVLGALTIAGAVAFIISYRKSQTGNL